MSNDIVDMIRLAFDERKVISQKMPYEDLVIEYEVGYNAKEHELFFKIVIRGKGRAEVYVSSKRDKAGILYIDYIEIFNGLKNRGYGSKIFRAIVDIVDSINVLCDEIGIEKIGKIQGEMNIYDGEFSEYEVSIPFYCKQASTYGMSFKFSNDEVSIIYNSDHKKDVYDAEKCKEIFKQVIEECPTGKIEFLFCK